MKKLTKRNRKRDRKVVLGYKCEPEQQSNYTTTMTTTGWLFTTQRTTCTYRVGGCCDP